MKQLISHVVIFLLVSTVLDSRAQSIATTWARGDGTKVNPYQISDISHLRKLAADCNNGIS